MRRVHQDTHNTDICKLNVKRKQKQETNMPRYPYGEIFIITVCSHVRHAGKNCSLHFSLWNYYQELKFGCTVCAAPGGLSRLETVHNIQVNNCFSVAQSRVDKLKLAKVNQSNNKSTKYRKIAFYIRRNVFCGYFLLLPLFLLFQA